MPSESFSRYHYHYIQSNVIPNPLRLSDKPGVIHAIINFTNNTRITNVGTLYNTGISAGAVIANRILIIPEGIQSTDTGLNIPFDKLWLEYVTNVGTTTFHGVLNMIIIWKDSEF